MNYADRNALQGGAGDTGAQKSVIGLQWALPYCDWLGIELELSPTRSKFIFGDQTSTSLGRMNIILESPLGSRRIDTHVVKARIPFLIGLDALDKTNGTF